MKLISMTDYVLEVTRGNNIKSVSSAISYKLLKQLESIINYANFLKQPLTLGMFVPCGEEGNVLEEPFYDPSNEQYWASELYQYQQAKSKVLFEGWEANNEDSEIVYNKNSFCINFEDEGDFILFTELLGEDSQITHQIGTIEELAILGYELPLTQPVIDQLK